ncbi:hypothetical protein D3C80_583330 [compost metagenome]
MKSKLEQQAELMRRIEAAQRRSLAIGIELTAEEALSTVTTRKGNRALRKANGKKKKKRSGGSMFLPGSFESNSR